MKHVYSYCIALLFFSFIIARPPTVNASSFYVSKLGNNQNGTSWSTAWNELNQIQWSLVKPGDTINIDGGSSSCTYPVTVTNASNQPGPANCGMTYTSTLTIGASGTATNPISIRVSNETGRNGTVRIFGGRSTPLGYCGQSNYSLNTANAVGIYLSGYSHIVVDGLKWAGIMIYGHNRHGIQLHHGGSQSDLIFRNIEIFDNGTYSGSSPDQPGIHASGTFLTFENVIVHDNGQDAFQMGYGNSVEHLTIRSSWLYNQRPHPSQTSDSYNYCTHTDGVQIYQYTGGKSLYGFTIEDSIIGPGFMQGFILGDYNSSGWSTLHDVTIRNSLIVGHHGSSSTAGVFSKYDASYCDDAPTNWLLDHVTVIRDPNQNWHNIYINGSGHSVTNSVFYGGREIMVQGSPTASGNINYLVTDYQNIANEVNPMFADNTYAGIGTGFADFDFTVTNPAIPAGTGSSIHTVADLLGTSHASPTPTEINPTTSPKPGDANGDGKVDGLDYIIWISHYTQNVSGPIQGDFNSDNKVDGLDYVIWVSHYNT